MIGVARPDAIIEVRDLVKNEPLTWLYIFDGLRALSCVCAVGRQCSMPSERADSSAGSARQWLI